MLLDFHRKGFVHAETGRPERKAKVLLHGSAVFAVKDETKDDTHLKEGALVRLMNQTDEKGTEYNLH